MKTIQFCGGSWCANTSPNSYLSILAESLDAKIIVKGEPGFGHERSIKTFDTSADYTVFTWSEPHILYHPNFSLNMASCNKKKNVCKVHRAGYLFFEFLHDWDYFVERQVRDLYWFDNVILSKSESKIIHLFSYEIDYQFKNGLSVDGFFLNDYSMGLSNGNDILNHMSIESNKRLADLLYENFNNWR